ncbi:unnamed protein product [Schistosoma margrebowiei]|uniref:Uncharacterized protein n=1 Tax=Schistosoma margrebowiei TaxID=48269 RepID=A0A183ME30_9TREM|nr:unnamed protein product [Schistosoma margrebowiei]
MLVVVLQIVLEIMDFHMDYQLFVIMAQEETMKVVILTKQNHRMSVML